MARGGAPRLMARLLPLALLLRVRLLSSTLPTQPPRIEPLTASLDFHVTRIT